MLDRLATTAEIVLNHAECAEVLRRRGIDFCCRGGLPLHVAAKSRGVDIDDLLSELSSTIALSSAIAAQRGEHGSDPRRLSTQSLIEHIVAQHHEYTRRTLPSLAKLAKTVARMHGAYNPKLGALADAVDALGETLIPHLDDEELRLFPALLHDAGSAQLAKHFASMVSEHYAVAMLLELVRSSADDFVVPDWACQSYRNLFSELERLEIDVFRHAHLENHVLMPRFSRTHDAAQ